MAYKSLPAVLTIPLTFAMIATLAIAGPRTPTSGLTSMPELAIPDQIRAASNSRVAIPISFTANGNDIAAFDSSVDYDETWLGPCDPTDHDKDGIPDSISFTVPDGFSLGAMCNPDYTDGEIAVAIADFSPPYSSLPDGTFITITLAVGSPSSTTEAAVNFSDVLFVDTEWNAVPGTTDNGSVLIFPISCPDFEGPQGVGIEDVQYVADLWHQPANPSLNCDADELVTVKDIVCVAALLGVTCE